MNQAALMRMMDGITDLHHDLEALARVQMMFVGIVSQRFAANELHGEVRLRPESGVRRARVIDLRDTGMLQASESLGLLSEASQQFRTRKASLDDFQSDGT